MYPIMYRIFASSMNNVQLVAAIVGGSGSGKTTLIKAVHERFNAGQVCLVSQDDHYYPIELQQVDQLGKVNFDLPTAIDLDALHSDVTTLLQGKEISRREYTFNNAANTGVIKRVKPAPILLVEGLFVMHDPRLRSMYQASVFVDAQDELRLERRLTRDARERGYGRDDVLYQWKYHVEPAYQQYLMPHRDRCTLCVDNSAELDLAADSIAAHLKGMLRRQPAMELA